MPETAVAAHCAMVPDEQKRKTVSDTTSFYFPKWSHARYLFEEQRAMPEQWLSK